MTELTFGVSAASGAQGTVYYLKDGEIEKESIPWDNETTIEVPTGVLVGVEAYSSGDDFFLINNIVGCSVTKVQGSSPSDCNIYTVLPTADVASFQIDYGQE